MDLDYWHERWANERTGWHKAVPNVLLTKYFPKLTQQQGAKVFVPLCGKTKDIGWLADNGCVVTGAELSEFAVKQLFDELSVQPKVTQDGEFKLYTSPNIRIFVGDFFALTTEQLGPVDVCFDRAALVALPPTMRIEYTKHLMTLTANAPQLLISLTYDQTQAEGPPHSVPAEEIDSHYQAQYNVESLSALPVEGGIKGVDGASEHVWLLTPK